MKRPPIGIVPKNVHDRIVDANRFTALSEAISRYLDAGMQIHVEWIEEYNELIDKLKIK